MSQNTKGESGRKLVSANRKARHEYEILETFEAGISLTGSEVKSLRAGKLSWGDGYVDFTNGEAFLASVHIAPYENAGYAQHEPERKRRLLLNGWELRQLIAKVEQKGLSVVPLAMYLKNGRFKVDIALARGNREMERDARRAMGRD